MQLTLDNEFIATINAVTRKRGRERERETKREAVRSTVTTQTEVQTVRLRAVHNGSNINISLTNAQYKIKLFKNTKII